MVLTPKEWWHHCSHADHHKNALSNEQTLDEDCPVCDLSLSVFTRPTAFVVNIVKQAPFVHGQTNYTGLSNSPFNLFQLRAPPASLMF
jgi:hypothetical protein